MTTQKNEKKAIFLKLFLNYSQILILSSDPSFKWGFILRFFFDIQTKVANPSYQIFSFDCLLVPSSQKIDVIYLKLILICILPFLLILLLLFIFAILKWLRKSNILENLINSIIITVSFVQPFIIDASFSIMSCLKIEGNEYFITSNLTTPCHTHEHFLYVFFILIYFEWFFLDWIISCPFFNFVVCCFSIFHDFLFAKS